VGIWAKVRERRAAWQKEQDRQALEDLEAESRGEMSLKSYKKGFRDERSKEGFPSTGAGYLPPP
jgi:hypothetical protein